MQGQFLDLGTTPLDLQTTQLPSPTGYNQTKKSNDFPNNQTNEVQQLCNNNQSNNQIDQDLTFYPNTKLHRWILVH